MNRNTLLRGFTLLEMVLAVAIVGVLLTLLIRFTSNINSTSNSLQNRINTTDAVRRLSEMMTQELRSTAFGVVASQPYVPSSTQISVLRPVLTSGNSAVGIGVVTTSNFQTSTSITTYTGSLSTVPANTFMVLLSGSAARLLKTSAATTTSTSQVFNHGSCQNVLSPTSATLSLVTPVGFRYDAANRMLYEKRGSAAETVLAWNVSAFALSYTYVNTTTGVESTSNTYSGLIITSGSSQSALRRINLNVSMTENGKAQSISNTINLVSPTGLNVNTYTECTI